MDNLKFISTIINKKRFLFSFTLFFIQPICSAQFLTFNNAFIYAQSDFGLFKVHHKKNSGSNKNMESNYKLSYSFSLKSLLLGKDLMIGTAFKYGSYKGNIKTNHLYNDYINKNDYQYNFQYTLLSFGLVFHVQFFKSENFALYYDLTPYYNKLNNYNIEVKLNEKLINPVNNFNNSEPFNYRTPFTFSSTIAAIITPKKRFVPTIGVSLDPHRDIFIRYTDASYSLRNSFINIGLQYKLYKPE